MTINNLRRLVLEDALHQAYKSKRVRAYLLEGCGSKKGHYICIGIQITNSYIDEDEWTDFSDELSRVRQFMTDMNELDIRLDTDAHTDPLLTDEEGYGKHDVMFRYINELAKYIQEGNVYMVKEWLMGAWELPTE